VSVLLVLTGRRTDAGAARAGAAVARRPPRRAGAGRAARRARRRRHRRGRADRPRRRPVAHRGRAGRGQRGVGASTTSCCPAPARPRSTPGCGCCAPPPRAAGPDRRALRPRRAGHRRGDLHRAPQGPAARAHVQGVRAAQVPRAARRPGVHPRAAAAGGLGLRLLRRHPHGRRARAAAARQARPRARAADRHRAQRRLQVRPRSRSGCGSTPRRSRRSGEVVTAAAEADGVHPLSEHVTLHLGHGGDPDARNVLARVDGRSPATRTSTSPTSSRAPAPSSSCTRTCAAASARRSSASSSG
jgi:hypothetical protein